MKIIKSDWERTDMASGPIWDKDNWRIIERRGHFADEDEKWYVLRDKSHLYKDDIRFDTLAEAMDYVDFRANLNSSRQIKSGLDPYLCCPNCGEPELFENIKEHNIKCYNCGNTISYDELKNLKKYVSPHSKIKSAKGKNEYVITYTKHDLLYGNDTSTYPISGDNEEDAKERFRNVMGNRYEIKIDNIELTNSRRPVKSGFVVKRNDTGEYLGWMGMNTEWMRGEENAIMYDSKEYIERHQGELGLTAGLPDGFTIIEVNSSHQITSARYIATDPESGEVLGSADTYEEAVNEWGEDVTITDSEVTEGQQGEDTGLFSSLNKNDKKFIKGLITDSSIEDPNEEIENYTYECEDLGELPEGTSREEFFDELLDYFNELDGNESNNEYYNQGKVGRAHSNTMIETHPKLWKITYSRAESCIEILKEILKHIEKENLGFSGNLSLDGDICYLSFSQNGSEKWIFQISIGNYRYDVSGKLIPNSYYDSTLKVVKPEIKGYINFNDFNKLPNMIYTIMDTNPKELNEIKEFNGLFSSWNNDTPRGEGWLAHDDGKQKNECPYERGTEEYEDWIDGWEAAYQEVNSSHKPIKSSISATALEEQLDGQFWTRAEDFEDEVNEAGWDIEDVNNEYATISNDKGSQYEVRFYDHGEGRSFTMESFKCIYCDEDDDDEIESNYQFNQRIVNSVLTKEITEDDAIKQIASRNNMNIGFAKRILSNLLEDKSLIQSGVMEMADDINKDFDLNGDLYSWFDDYVEDDGKSTTVGGELVRAANQIIARFDNDGDKIGIGYGKETVNPAARYILAICNDYIDRNDIEEMLWNESRINYSDEDYEAWLQQFERTFTNYLRDHEELFHAPNKNDIWDYKEDDDVDSSVTECCIYDDNGNEYWFQKDDDGWKCTSIEYTSDPKYKVDNYVDDLDDIPDTSDDFCDFELDGFEYSAERASNGEDWIITNVSIDNGLADAGDVWDTDDFNDYTVYDANGREINVSDLY